jgi:hypothetical protein
MQHRCNKQQGSHIPATQNNEKSRGMNVKHACQPRGMTSGTTQLALSACPFAVAMAAAIAGEFDIALMICCITAPQ